MDFSATHRITFKPSDGQPRAMEVMLGPDGAAPTQQEHAAGLAASWKFHEGLWYWVGIPMMLDASFPTKVELMSEIRVGDRASKSWTGLDQQ